MRHRSRRSDYANLSKGSRVVGMSPGALDESDARIRYIAPAIEMALGYVLDEAYLDLLFVNVRSTDVCNLGAHLFLPDHRAARYYR
jgi:hypothetical protein